MNNLEKKCALPSVERTLIVWHFSTGSAAVVEKAGTCRAHKRLLRAMPTAVSGNQPPVLNCAWKTFGAIDDLQTPVGRITQEVLLPTEMNLYLPAMT